MDAKIILKIVLAIFMIFAGSYHFVKPDFYIRMIPSSLPNPRGLIIISGLFEILGGVGLLIPQTTIFSAWGLVALLFAVFPANFYMAIKSIPYVDGQPAFIAWLRLPMQFIFIAWALMFTK